METLNKRITPDLVTHLSSCEIFVFGSNLDGLHMGGAAKTAFSKFGAVWGVGDGPTGQCYAIPTMHGGVDDIKPYVEKFIEYVKAHPANRFLLTRIGCGIAGFKDAQIAPLFDECLKLSNVSFPREWIAILLSSSKLPQKIDAPKVISERLLKKLCRQYNYEIGAGVTVHLPSIGIRYVVDEGKFGYASFGNFFFYGDHLYVFGKDDTWQDEHNQEVVMETFKDECLGRGYARRMIFAGIRTCGRDMNDEYIYTGDVLRVNVKNAHSDSHPYHLALDTWQDEYYAFIVDNHHIALKDCRNIYREGTVFYKLNKLSYLQPVFELCIRFNLSGVHVRELLLLSRYTPSFEQDNLKYKALQKLGVEYNWRR